MTDSTAEPLAFAPHDHGACAAETLAEAERLVDAAGARMTPVRRRALEILLSEHRAFGAYEVLDRLTEDGFARQPPVAYRALDFLVEQGLVHRVRRLNAFAACTQPGTDHAPVFLICGGCNAVAEAPADAVRAALAEVAGRMEFTVERANVEALGRCRACREAA